MACKSLNKVKLGDDIGTDMISIGVGNGSKRQTFSIHKALLPKLTTYFCKALKSEDGQLGLIFLKDDDPEIFKMFYDWLYTGNVQKAPTNIPIKTIPNEAEIQRLEDDLLQRFNAHMVKLVELYLFAVKLDINDLQNNAIDRIQDGYHEYGTVFGPLLLVKIFNDTVKGNKLRELCLAANVIHSDRGCEALRNELIQASILTDDFLPEMLKWVSRNFVMFGRRQSEGFDVRKPTHGFSMLNRKKLCPCHFHKHGPGEAHKGHKKCAVPFMTCGHAEEGDESMDTSA